ncbi:MAG: DUF1553 domain-containing protein [Pirellulaceae bacterium]
MQDPTFAPVKTPLRRRLFRLALGLTLALLLIGMLQPVQPVRDQLKAAASGKISPASMTPKSPMAYAIDHSIDQAIQAQGLHRCPPADAWTICRRLNLALVGSGLSLEEMRWLEAYQGEDLVGAWTKRLLADPRCSDYLAERLARAYVGTAKGPFILYRRRKFVLWLAQRLREETPYDQLVRQLIASEGLWTDQPQVNFLTATMDEADNGRADPNRLAGRTSRAFLGMRLDCLQCHDDFLGNSFLGDHGSPQPGTQQHFHGLAAFFAGARVASNPFSGLRDDQAEHRYQRPGEADPVAISMQVPYGASWLPEEGKPRIRLAAWVTHPENRMFARSAVNRFWAILFGKPWIEPVDDLPLHGPYPEAFELLVDQFIQSGYSWKYLVRLISSLDAFRRDSRSEAGQVLEEHERLMAAFPLSPLRPEQIAQSIHQAARVSTIDQDSSILWRLEQFFVVNDFLKEYGDLGELELEGMSETIPQRLMVMNGKLVDERVRGNPVVNATSRMALAPTPQAIESLYLAALNRKPTQSEIDYFTPWFDSGNPIDATGDVLWALVNSTEFLWNH